jgi:hypothetical protein
MNMRIVVKVIYNIFGPPRDIMVRRFKVRFKEIIDHFISHVIAVAAINFMLDGKSFPTTVTDRDRRRWLMPVSNSVDRDHGLPEFFASHFHILG